MAACHLVRRKSNFPSLGQREYQAKTGKLEFTTRTQTKAIYVVLNYDRSKKKKLKLDSSTSEFLLSSATLALHFGNLPNILLSGFSSERCR